MKFTVFHLSQSPEWMTDAEVLREEVGLMTYADELGFDAVWMAEHHFHHYCVCPDPLLLAAHAAANTRRIRIGTAANVLTLGHPLRIAEQAAMVDCLSGGRLDVGFAKGYGPREFAAYGVELPEAGERFREAVEIILGAWTQDEFTYQGKHFQVPYPVTLRPRPVQQPPPPGLRGHQRQRGHHTVRRGAGPLVLCCLRKPIPVPEGQGRVHRLCGGGGPDPGTDRGRGGRHRGDADLVSRSYQRGVL